jgi:hypothetical protein
MERDNVPPGYLRTIRTLVLNEMHSRLDARAATAVWVRSALGDSDAKPDAVRSVVAHRFGGRAVTYDPSDPEANKLAVVAGYTVVHGGQLSGEEWENVRRAGALKPAGQVTPSSKPFSPDGLPLPLLPRSEWSASERTMVDLYKRLGPHLVETQIEEEITACKDVDWMACYGPGCPIILCRPKLGSAFFADGASERALALLIHELGHHYAGDHLSREYYDALTRLGARLALAVAKDPEILR